MKVTARNWRSALVLACIAVGVSALYAAKATSESAFTHGEGYTQPVPRLTLPRWLGGQPAVPPSRLEIQRGGRHLGIFYGWPSSVNGAAGNVDAAAATFAKFSVIVLGDGIEQPSHPDHQATRAILDRLRGGGATRVFGYVDLGVTTQNLSIDAILGKAGGWQALGAVGIFLDDAGADFGVETARRDAAVDGIHRIGLAVILNAHDPDDAFRGTAPLSPGDGYLFESFQISDGRILPPEPSLRKADRALELSLAAQVDVYALASGPPDDPGLAEKHSYAWWSTLLYGFAYFQYTTIDYGSRSGQLPWYPQDVPELGDRYLDASVHHTWGDGQHRRSTDRGEIRLTTGSSTGGSFDIKP